MLVTHLNSGHTEQETYNEVKHIRPHTHKRNNKAKETFTGFRSATESTSVDDLLSTL